MTAGGRAPTVCARARLAPLALGLLLASAGCGEESATPASILPMAPGPAQPAAPVDPAELPSLGAVRFDPALPLAGRAARAIVETEGLPRSIELEYRFRVGGRDVAAERDRVDLIATQPGERLEVTVTPRLGEAVGQAVHHAVRLRAPAPRVMGVSFVPPEPYMAGVSIEARPIVEDGDPRATTHRFEWLVNGQRQSVYDGVFSTAGLRRGDEIRVEVSAWSDGASSEPFTSEPILLENGAPELRLGSLDVDDTGGIDSRLAASDPDADAPIGFALLDGPSGLTVTPDGQLRWPDAAAHPGHHAVEIELRDPLGATRKTRFSVDIGTPAAPAS